ncbi:hypothetical protein [Methylorubrum salsuginis]|nr:hypothetical protein [Methylorubrum salsuginis]
MRGSDLTPQEIAARTGVPYSTVCRWNLVQNWRPAVLRAREAHRPQKWSQARVAALARVARVPGVDPGDLAEALGARRDRAESLFRACGLSETITPQSAVGRAQRRAGPDGSLRAALRVHLARQIGELDGLLAARGRQDILVRLERAGKLDTAKMLRNLVGLKKLLDEVEPPSEGRGAGDDEGGGDGRLDLVALRADLVRRYAAFAARNAAAAQGASQGALEGASDTGRAAGDGTGAAGDPWAEGIAGGEPAGPGGPQGARPADPHGAAHGTAAAFAPGRAAGAPRVWEPRIRAP